MEWKYCWRCKAQVPFLDDNEYERVSDVYQECIEVVKQYRKSAETRPSIESVMQLFEPVQTEYASLTGWKGMHHNAIMHHQFSRLGSDCPVCRKPLRTAVATMCPECGWRK